jgi:hypothetical protein
MLVLAASTAWAGAGDPRVVQGTLAWSPGADGTPFVVVRGDDGRHYVADLSTAQRRGERPIVVGDRVSVVGVEGARPWEVSTVVVGLGDAALAALPLPAAPATTPPGAPGAPAAPAPPRAAPADRPWQRIEGTVDSMSGDTLRLRGRDGRNVSVDLSQLKGNTTSALRPGDRATVFVVSGEDQRLVAVGLVQTDGPEPSASPRQRR